MPNGRCSTLLLLLGVLEGVACGGNEATVGPHDGGLVADAAADAAADGGEPVDATSAPDASTAEAGDAAMPAVDASEDAADSSVDAPGEASVTCDPTTPTDAGPPITVTGHVVDAFGNPVRAPVTIQGRTTMTATDGSFQIDGVTVPYDVEIASSDANAVAYVGLTRPDPVLVNLAGGVGLSGNAIVLGTLAGAPDAGVLGAFVDMTAAPGGGVDSNYSGSSPDFDLLAVWNQAPTASGTVWGLAGTVSATGGLTAITAVGSTPITVDLGSNLTGVTVPLSPVGAAASMLTGTVTLPGTDAVQQIGLGLGRGGYTATFTYDVPPSGATSFAYGTFTGGPTWALTVQAGPPASATFASVYRTGLQGDATVQIDVPSCDITYLSPAPSSTVLGPCVDLAWSAAPSSIYVVAIQTMTNPVSTYLVVTTQTPLHVPYVLPPGSYAWDLRQIAGVASMDALTASFATAAILDQPGYSFVVDHAECTNFDEASFTMK